MGLRMTLRFRMISLIALFAIVLIAAFTALLIGHQLQTITENNLYRARVGSFAVKGTLERSLLSIRTGDPTTGFQKLMPVLYQGQLAEEVSLADLKGKVVASTSETVGSQISLEESQWMKTALKTFSPQNWFHARVNPSEILLFVPITLDEVPQYVAILRYSLGNMKQAIQQVSKLCILVATAVILFVVPLCLILIQAILGPIQILNRATKDVAAGNLSLQVSVPTEDELGELAVTFNAMTAALVKMKERAENANPLTKLPGNNIIHEQVEKRIQQGAKFAVVYADLDNFKAFNDKYGISIGDKVIALTAATLRQSLKRGGPTDFLGHEGGDDFVLITTPEKVGEVAGWICSEFDRQIKELYSPEDRAKGYILSRNRKGEEEKFPLMTISLVGVTNQDRKLASYGEVTNICAEMKNASKKLSQEQGKSSFLMDRRGPNREPVTGQASGTAASPP